MLTVSKPSISTMHCIIRCNTQHWKIDITIIVLQYLISVIYRFPLLKILILISVSICSKQSFVLLKITCLLFMIFFLILHVHTSTFSNEWGYNYNTCILLLLIIKHSELLLSTKPSIYDLYISRFFEMLRHFTKLVAYYEKVWCIKQRFCERQGLSKIKISKNHVSTL